MTRIKWLDEKGGVAIDELARRLESYVETMADGFVSDDELAAQEKRVAALLKVIEPKLDDTLHREVTELLCEMTAFDIMQVFYAMQDARPSTKFRG